MAESPDIEGLDRFGRSRARHLTKFFVGRQPEMKVIRDAVHVVDERYRQGHPKPGEDGAVLITGVPGAGKTSLMTKMRNFWSAPEGDGPIGIELALTDLTNRAALIQALQRNVPSGVRGWVADRLSSVSVGAFGTDISFDLAQPYGNFGGTGRPIVLFIDEIERIPIDPQAPAVQLLAVLQDGTHGGPIQPVLAGLAHARKRLEDAGMSRIDPVLPLVGLSRDEVRESVNRFLDTFRVAGDRSEWPDIIIRSADGWPMHLHNALRALAGELAVNGGDLDRVVRFAVKQQAARRRLDHYGNRTREVLDEHPELLAAIMDGIGADGLTKAESLRLIRRLATGRDTVPPAGEAFDAMLAKGLIQVGPMEDYSCPIPSMRSWCAARTGNRLHRLTMVGDSDAIRQRLDAGDDPHAKDTRGRTPLHIAAEENWPNVAAVLLAANATPVALDNAGRRPVDLARAGSEAWELLAGLPDAVDCQ